MAQKCLLYHCICFNRHVLWHAKKMDRLLKFSLVFPCFRYHIEYEALSKVESEQNEFIDQFILQKWRCDCDHVSRVPVLCSLGDIPFRELLCCSSFSEAIPKRQHRPETAIPPLYTLLLTRLCVMQQPAGYCSCSHPGQQVWGFTVFKLHCIWNIWSSVHTKCLNINISDRH